MSESGAAPVSISLQDGTQLTVTPAGIQLGAHFFEMSSIQDARQVSPNPETFALRVAGNGLVEFQPVRPGDGTLALDALFRIRPDLRPAGFIGPSDRPGYPPPPLYPPGPRYPPLAPSPQQGYGTPAGAYSSPPAYGYAPRAMYGPSPNSQQGELTPYPRTFGELLGAIFQLYGKHFRKWLALGFWVILLPGILLALAQTGVEALLGINPFDTTPLPQFPIGSNCLPQISAALQHELVIVGSTAAGAFVVSLLIGAWATASFANAGREAILSRPIPIGASLGRGARRLLPTLGTTIAVLLIVIAVLAPGIVCLVISVAGITGSGATNLCAQAITTSATAPAPLPAADDPYLVLTCVGFLLLIAGFFFSLFLAVRLVIAPVIAATERGGIGTALSRSWQLTRRSWWRCFGVLFVILVVVVLVALVITSIGTVPVAAVALVATPLAQWLISPLQELMYIVLLFDLRLRREGYAAVTQAATAPAGATPYGPPSEPPAQS